MAYVNHMTADGIRKEIRDKEAVSFVQEQTLTAEQKARARANIGAADSGDVDELKSQMDNIARNEIGNQKLKTDEITVNTGSASTRIIIPVYLEPNTSYIVRNTAGSLNALVNISATGTTSDTTYLIQVANYTSVPQNTGLTFNSGDLSGWYILYIRVVAVFGATDWRANRWMVTTSETGVIDYVDFWEGYVILDDVFVNADKLGGKSLQEIEANPLYPIYQDFATWGNTPIDTRTFDSVKVYLNSLAASSLVHTTDFANGTRLAQSSIQSLGVVTANCGIVAFLHDSIAYTERDFGVCIYSPAATTKNVNIMLAELTTTSLNYNRLSKSARLKQGWNFVRLTEANIKNENPFTRIILEFQSADFNLTIASGLKVALVYGIGTIIDYIDSPRNDYSLIAYGDSLTQGTGSSGVGYRYIDICKTELNALSAIPFGYGGSASRAIAYTAGGLMGYVPPNTRSFALKYADMTSDISIALNQLNGKTVVIDGTEYTISQTGNTAYSLPDTYTPSDMWLPAIVKNSQLTADIYIIWIGTNDNGMKWDIINDIISKLPHNQYIVMGLTKLGDTTTIEDEKTGYETYGSHYFNTRMQIISNAFQVLNMTPTAEDTAAMNAGLIPPSLLYDNTHFNDSGYEAIGKLLARHIKAVGYKYQM